MSHKFIQFWILIYNVNIIIHSLNVLVFYHNNDIQTLRVVSAVRRNFYCHEWRIYCFGRLYFIGTIIIFFFNRECGINYWYFTLVSHARFQPPIQLHKHVIINEIYILMIISAVLTFIGTPILIIHI